MEIKSLIRRGLDVMHPVKDVAMFLFLFVTFDFVWKLCVHEGVGDTLLVFGKDYTSSVRWLNVCTADIVHWFVHSLLGYSNFKIDDTVLYFEAPKPLRLSVVWGCTGAKQMIMFTFVMIFCYGPKKKKYWFIPMAFVLLNLVNVFRIAAVALIVKDGFPSWFIPFDEWYNNRVWVDTVEMYWTFYKDWFQFFHYDVFRWLYYDGVMFLLWLWWQEGYNLPYRKQLQAKVGHLIENG